MRLSYEIAKRYLLGKKSTNAINIITWVSVLGLSIGTAALILILTVFNGFEAVLTGLFDSFNPQLKVEIEKGKYFEVDESTWLKLSEIDGLESFSRTIEEVALFDYKGVEEVGIIKGVDSNFSQVTNIDSSLRSGKIVLDEGRIKYGIVGTGMGAKLNLNYKDALTPISVHMPRRKNRGPLSKDFKTLDIYATGIFSSGGESDGQYLLTNYEYVNNLLDFNSKLTALEIRLKEGASEKKAKSAILDILGEGFTVKNRYEQDETYFKVMNTEKWVGFMITSFVMLIIAFNLVGALWMLVLEKKHDLSILQAMGLRSDQVRNIILNQGLLITLIGLVSGMSLAVIIYLIHKSVGLVHIPDNFVIDRYPADLQASDFLIVTAVVLIIGILASLLPAFRATKITANQREEL